MHIRADSFSMEDSDVSDIQLDSDVSDIQLHPGPKDPSVLHLQAEHRSTNIWKAGGGDIQRSRVRNKFTSVHPRMVPYLKNMHFDGVARLTGIQIDWSLVTAMVERWRPETHTFHLPTGECTITLQDVSILLGLRVNGRAITGSTEFKGGWAKIVQDMFGKVPSKESSDLVGGRLKLCWLSKNFTELPDNADEDEVIRHTQSFVLQLIGGVLFTDHQGSQLHCMFIPLIQNLERSSTLSWGSGVLAFLYRELCKACKIGVEEVAGCVLLLQLWAWTRLPTLAPVPRGPCSDNQDIWADLGAPFGLRWCAPKSFTDVSSHVVFVTRLSLDVLTPNHFTWLPYDDILEKLPKHCTEDHAIWCYMGPLICFHIVEPHQPDRCVRQFGMIQDVPSAPTAYSPDLHKINLKGKTDVDWRDKHREHINYWNKRDEHVYNLDNVGVGVTNDYAVWYAAITRPYHTRIAAAQSHMFNVLDRISLIARGEIPGDIRSIDDLATQGRRLLEYQYSCGLNQDFQCDNRLAKEELARGKPKRAGHKGGRGGVNAPKRRAIEMDDGRVDHVHEDRSVHFGDDGGDHVVDEVGNAPHSNRPSIQTEHEARARVVDFTPPTFNLLSSGDFQWPPRQEHLNQQDQPVDQHQPQKSDEEGSVHLGDDGGYHMVDEVGNAPHSSHSSKLSLHRAGDTSIQTEHETRARVVDFTPPTFNLLSSGDFQWPPRQELDNQQEQLVNQQESVQPQQPHQAQEQQPIEEQQAIEEQPIEEQGQQVVEEHPMEEQEHPVEEPEQQVNDEQLMHDPEEEVAEPHHMVLRPRNSRGVRCGTDGCKQYKRLRWKYK